MRLISSLCVFAFASVGAQEKCETPNKEEAKCISLYSCPVLLAAVTAQATQPNSSVVEFVEKSNCGGTPSHPLVCCGSTYTFTVPQNQVKVNRLLPDRRYCGYQHADDYFRDRGVISIDEFPWFANLLYESVDGLETRCGATLISNRYVLTAARCAVLLDATIYNLTTVRLGKYYRRRKEEGNKTDCVTYPDFDECNEPQDYGIEKVIPHFAFNTGGFYWNDIALIRLNETVSYSDYIRPICLPLPGPTLAKVGDTLTTTGWGLISNMRLAEKKKKIHSNLISNVECIQAYKDYQGLLNLTGNQFCTTYPANNTEFLCSGDLGSPIMFSVRSQWHQEGISSLGIRTSCHTGSKFPEIYTKVVNYIDWIKENIEP